jgi:hypothetical protein
MPVLDREHGHGADLVPLAMPVLNREHGHGADTPWGMFKYEIRSTKSETNPKSKCPKASVSANVARFECFEHLSIWAFGFVSDFGFRASDFVLPISAPSRLWPQAT